MRKSLSLLFSAAMQDTIKSQAPAILLDLIISLLSVIDREEGIRRISFLSSFCYYSKGISDNRGSFHE